MTKTLALLWNGNIEPAQKSGRSNKEIKELERLLQQNLEKLEDALNEKESKILERYNACIDEYLCLTNEQAFCDGFCLGTKITGEALSGAEDLMEQ